MKKLKLSLEEIELKKIERANRRAEKEEAKIEKKAAKVMTEAQIVQRYANRIINNQQYHGRIDESKFPNLKYDKKVNKKIWMDENFYFSVVFQSSEQVVEFLDKLGMTTDEVDQFVEAGSLKIINGLKFAEKLGISLEKIPKSDYPLANIELMPYVLDQQEV